MFVLLAEALRVLPVHRDRRFALVLDAVRQLKSNKKDQKSVPF